MFAGVVGLSMADASGRRWDAASADDLDSALRRLAAAPDGFVILQRGDYRFMQVAHPGRGMSRGAQLNAFQLEYQDGAEDRHFLTFSRHLDDVFSALRGYAAGRDNWREAFEWQRLDIGPSDAPDPRTPKEMVDAACADLSDRAGLEGFRLVKSRRELIRRRGPWTDRITLGTSAHNARGVYSELNAGTFVAHDALVSWRERKNRRPQGGRVALVQLGYLVDSGAGHPTWNLYDEYKAAIWQLHTYLAGEAVSFFNAFDDDLAFVDTLTDRVLGLLFVSDVVELLISQGAIDQLGRYLARLAAAKPLVAEALRDLVADLRHGHTPGRTLLLPAASDLVEAELDALM
jgi:hypothetical protein